MSFPAYVLIFGVCGFAGALQTTEIEQAGVVNVKALEGHVDFASTGLAAKGVLVELCKPNWKAVIASTRTDERGYFSFKTPKSAGISHLRLSAPGVNTYKMRVRIKPHGAQNSTYIFPWRHRESVSNAPAPSASLVTFRRYRCSIGSNHRLEMIA